MKRCVGFDGGTYVELWSLFTSQPQLQAALDLAEKLSLDVDVAALRMLGADLVGQARTAITAGDLATARTKIDQAVAFDPTGIEPGRLSAEIYLKSGDKDRAHEEFLRIIDIAIAAQDHPAARALLSPLLQADPKNVPLALRRLALARSEGAPPNVIQAQLNLAALYGESGAVASELQSLDELVSLAACEPATLERIASIHQHARRPAKMIEILALLAPIYEAAKDWSKLADSLARSLAHAPDDLAVAEHLALTHLKLGKNRQAVESLLALADAHKSHAAPLKAQALLKQILLVEPQNTAAIERLALLAADLGHRKDAVEFYRSLAAIHRSAAKFDEAARFLARARAIDPDDYALRRDLAEAQLSQNNLDEGIAELFGLADACLSDSDPSEGFAILDRIAELVPADLQRQIEIGRSLEAAGYDDRALQGYEILVRRLQNNARHEDALSVCSEARRLAPRDDRFLDLTLDSFLALGRKNDALNVLREAAAAYLDFDNLSLAEAFLLRALKIDPTSLSLKSDLARVYERASKHEDAVNLFLQIALAHRAADSPDLALLPARDVLRLDPANIDAMAILAESLELTGQLNDALPLWISSADILLSRDPNSPQALRVFQHILQLDPANLSVSSFAAQLMFRLSGPIAALPLFSFWIDRAGRAPEIPPLIEALSVAVASFPDELHWRSRLADLLLKNDRPQAAIPHLEIILLSASRPANKDDTETARILELLVPLCPDRLDLRLEFADCLAKKGDLQPAAQIFADLARHHLDRENFEEALSVLQRSLIYQPENRDLLLQIAQLLERVGHKPDAIAAYQKLLELSRRFDTWRSNVAAIENLLKLCPDRLDLRTELAKTFESHGDVDSALAQYLRIAQILRRKDLPGADTLAVIEKQLHRNPPALPSPNALKALKILLTLGFHSAYIAIHGTRSEKIEDAGPRHSRPRKEA